jgi:hypothetical protein
MEFGLRSIIPGPAPLPNSRPYTVCEGSKKEDKAHAKQKRWVSVAKKIIASLAIGCGIFVILFIVAASTDIFSSPHSDPADPNNTQSIQYILGNNTHSIQYILPNSSFYNSTVKQPVPDYINLLTSDWSLNSKTRYTPILSDVTKSGNCKCTSAPCSCTVGYNPTQPWEYVTINVDLTCTDLDNSAEIVTIRVNGVWKGRVGGVSGCFQKCSRTIPSGPIKVYNPDPRTDTPIIVQMVSNRHVDWGCYLNGARSSINRGYKIIAAVSKTVHFTRFMTYAIADRTVVTSNYVTSNGKTIAVLGWELPSSADQSGCQTEWELMPYGWQLASEKYRDAIAGHAWGTAGIVAGNVTFATKSSAAPPIERGHILQSGKYFRPAKCPQRILIIHTGKSISPSANFINITLPTVSGVPCNSSTCTPPFKYAIRLGRADESCLDTCRSYGETVGASRRIMMNTPDELDQALHRFGIACNTTIISNSLSGNNIMPAIYDHDGYIICTWSAAMNQNSLASKMNGMRLCECW